MALSISAGHNPAGKIACGASGLLDESKENRLIKDEMIVILRQNGVTTYDDTENNGKNKDDVLEKCVSKCNSHKVDFAYQIHLNSGRNDYVGDGKQAGFEVWICAHSKEKDEIAELARKNMAALGFADRGTKIPEPRKGLYFLNHTKAPALLFEVCFVDDRDDYNLYQKVGYKAVAKALAYAVMRKELNMSEVNKDAGKQACPGRIADAAEADGKWYYYEDGKKKNYTGVAPNKYGWFYVENGVVNFNYNGLAANNAGWWKIKGGAVDFSYTGIAGNDAGAWYVKNGAVDFNHNGEIKVKVVGGNVRLA